MIPHSLGHEDGGDLAFQGGKIWGFSLRMAEMALFFIKDGFSPIMITRLVKVPGGKEIGHQIGHLLGGEGGPSHTFFLHLFPHLMGVVPHHSSELGQGLWKVLFLG